MKRTSKGILLVALVVLMTLLLFACNGIKIGINFVVDGESYYQIKTNGEEEITMPDPPDKEGYVFKGWFFDENVWQEQLTIYSLINRPLDSVIDVYAYFITQEEADRLRTVNFNSMGAGEIESVETKVGMLIEEPSVSKSGYLFSGWFTSPDFATKWDFAKNTVSSDMTLYAKWVEDIPENRLYTVSFNTNGGSSVDNVSDIVYNTTITKPTNPTRSGYALVGWYTDNTFAKEWNFAQDTVKTSFTLYAKWERADVAACELVSAEGFAIDADTLYIKTPNAQAVFNFLDKIEVSAFASWTVVNDLQGKDVVPSGNVELNVGDNTKYILVTSYDGLHKKFYTVTIRRRPTYSVTLIHNNGTEDTVNATYEEDASIDFPELELEGYTLAGWTYEEDEEEEVWADTDTVQGNITLNAKWTANEYTVTFNSDGGNDIESKSVVFDDEYTFPVPEKRGYTFKGWSYHDELITDDEGACVTIWNTAKDVTVKAVWEETVYTITYENARGAVNNNAVSYTITQNVTFNTLSKDGYVFRKWLDEEKTEITGIEVGSIGNRTITAEWTLVGYAATFFADGAEVETLDFNVETTSLVEPAIPEKTGYTSAWETYSFPAHDITVNAIYTPIVYTIIYHLNDGENDEENPATYTVEDGDIALLAASKVGHSFIAWFASEEYNEVVTEIASGSHGTKHLYAKYSVNQYTISFESNGGTSVTEITQNYGTEVTAPASPAKNGYSFAGWFSDSGLKNAYTFTTIAAEDITLYAKWSLVTYTITYQLDGGTNNKANPATFTITSSEIVFSDPTKAGYNFIGWYGDNGFTVSVPGIVSGSYGDKEVFAKWQTIVYDVTYIVPENTINSNIDTFTVETAVTTLSDATKTGYTFNGWFADAGYNSPVVSIAGGAIGNVTVYGKFTSNTYNIWLDGEETASYNVSFNLNGASGSVAGQTVTEENTLVYPTKPTRDGYIFGGWYDNSECTGALYDFTAQVKKNTVLYAKWVSVGTATPIEIGSTANAAIVGQNDLEFIFLPLVSGNVTITASGSIDTYGRLYNEAGVLIAQDDDNAADGLNFLIVYNVTAGKAYTVKVRGFGSAINGNITLSLTGNNVVEAGGYVVTATKSQATYDAAFSLPVPEARDGYKFLGYADGNDTMKTDKTGASLAPWDIADDTVLYSIWERTVYTVTLNANGGTLATNSFTLAFGERMDLNEYVPTLEGKTFKGWYRSVSDTIAYEATTMPDQNISLIAKWTQFDLGEIKYNADKNAVSVSDEITAALFDAICLDTNGEMATFDITLFKGYTVINSIVAGDVIRISIDATSGDVSVNTVIENVKVYGAPTISDAEKTDFKVEDEITVATLGLTAKDTYNVALEIALSVKNGTQTAGNTMVYTASVTDVAGNTTTKDVTVKIYGTPTVSYNKSSLKVTENPIGDPDILNATATDSFGASLAVTVSLLSGNLSEGGTYVTYRLTATDHLGNVGTLNTDPISVYDVADIELVLSAYDDIVKLNSHGEEFDPSATDSFGNSCTFSLEAASGYSIAAGNTVTLYVVATDPAGNKVYSEALPEIKIYGIPTVTYAHEYPYITASEIDSLRYMFTVKDSFNKGLTPKTNVTSEDDDSIVVTVTATDAAKNTVSVEYTLLKIGNGKSYFALYDGDTFIGHQLVTIGSAYDLPVERTGYTFVSWKENGTGSALTDNAGHSLAVWSGEETAYKLVRETTIIVYTVTYNLNGGTNGINPSTFTIVSAEGGIALNDPRKNVSETINVGEYLGNGNYRVTMEATGYTFLGWFTESTFENEVTEITYTGSDVVLYAKWSETTTTQTTTGTQQLFTRENDYIYYGTYPQTQVTDSATKSALTSMAGTLPTRSNSQAWTSYGYYINGSVSNFMWHIDLEYNGEKYRGVYFTSYRPYYTGNSSSTSNSYQDDNGYYTSTVYWFKYDPIKWRILSEANGEALILCEMIIDSQEYCHYTSTSQFSHNGGTGYPNNYALSNIRKWLNDTFYNTAFNDLQKAIIQLTTVDNSARSTNPNNNATAFNSGANTYACANTEDYVFLLSEQEVTNSAYGFNADYSNYDTVRRKKTTAYAQCQGAYTSTSSDYLGNGYWWQRSPAYTHSGGARFVAYGGGADHGDFVHYAFYGVVPALKIRLS